MFQDTGERLNYGSDMNRELKVPAALSIMLVGFGAMIFWCGKPIDEAGAELASADFSEIDAEIQDRPNAPHLIGLESDVPSVEFDEFLGKESNEPAVDVPVIDDISQTAPAGQETGGQLITSRPIGDSPSVGEFERKFDAEFDREFQFNDDFLNELDADLNQRGVAQQNSMPKPIPTSSTGPAPVKRPSASNDGWEVVETSPAENDSRYTASNTVSGGQTYVIQPGDTLSRIAAQFLGSSHRAQEIFEANRNVLTDPNRLRVGTEIVIPNRVRRPQQELTKPDGPVAESNPAEAVDERLSMFQPVSGRPLGRRAPDEPENVSSDAREYRVRRGDTLERISLRVYGTTSKARDIYRANADRLSSPNSIREGMTLLLP